jgi:hypothetical protein
MGETAIPVENHPLTNFATLNTITLTHTHNVKSTCISVVCLNAYVYIGCTFALLGKCERLLKFYGKKQKKNLLSLKVKIA